MKSLWYLLALLPFCLVATGEDKPNIILCMTDNQGWGDVGYNGHPHLKTPHLDQMALEGVTFTRFDPSEARNLVQQKPEVAQRMKSELSQWKAMVMTELEQVP